MTNKPKSKNQKYIVLEASSGSSLQEQVNKHIKEYNGMPLGGISFVVSPSSGSWYYAQAMMTDYKK